MNQYLQKCSAKITSGRIKIQFVITAERTNFLQQLPSCNYTENRYMFNSKGDNFTDDHFKTSFARTSCIN